MKKMSVQLLEKNMRNIHKITHLSPPIKWPLSLKGERENFENSALDIPY